MRGTKSKKIGKLIANINQDALMKLREVYGDKTEQMTPQSAKRALRKMYKEHLIKV